MHHIIRFFLNFRKRCDVPYSECKATDHVAECVCKKDFKGNGTVECIPEGFSQEENGKLCHSNISNHILFIHNRTKGY